jgi:YggT family protein
MIGFLIQLVNIVSRILVLVIVVDAVTSFFMSPYHPFREMLGRILNPIYNPIRRVVKPIGGLDLTPLIVLLSVQLLAGLLRSLLISLGT